MNSRLVYAAPATLLALVALGLAIAGFLSTKKNLAVAPDTQERVETTVASAPAYRYLLATRGVLQGQALSADAFVTVLSDNPLPEAIGAEEAPFGAAVKTAIMSGELLTASKLEPNSLLQRLVAPGYQALAIPLDDVAGVGGLLRPGDRVDVNASFRRSDKANPAAVRLLRNVMVIAVKGVTQDGSSAGDDAHQRNNTVVLEVPEGKVPDVLLASAEGQLRLAAIAAPEGKTGWA
ncbi:Flp pilus assembly protein CpaB [Pseudomonas sp. OIL-1]|uniref:Flp pilus assembly protein CpaB n=1 Tax=Pseudomonas sp. OIL-1 TaxID=2706126 RepID=UPI0013A78696|nr:Flp pilus assembly protein CpaB [Pseudomonas sp. OIL-1]QIB52924.1 Flp pilus assembly protein CpaB [Pseudomonas sp. OIL-1]